MSLWKALAGDLIESRFALQVPLMALTGSWFHAPKRGNRFARNDVAIDRGCRHWSGSWTLEGDQLVVISAYGSRSARAGSERGRTKRAEKLLREIVDARVRP